MLCLPAAAADRVRTKGHIFLSEDESVEFNPCEAIGYVLKISGKKSYNILLWHMGRELGCFLFWGWEGLRDGIVSNHIILL